MLIIYTTEEGGEFKIWRGIKEEKLIPIFEKAKKTGFLQGVKEKLAYIVLLSLVDNYDFVIKRERQKGCE